MSDFGENGRQASDGAEEQTGGSAGEGRAWRVRTERLRVTGGDLWGKLRQLVHEGNVRRIIIRNEDERILIEIPVTVGVVGFVLAPFAVAVGAVAAVVTHCTIEVERFEEVKAEGEPGEGAAPAGDATSESSAGGGVTSSSAEGQPVGESPSGDPETAAANAAAEAGAETDVAEEIAQESKKRRRKTT